MSNSLQIKKLTAQTFLEATLSSASRFTVKTAGITHIDKTWLIKERTLPDHLLYYLESGAIDAVLNKKHLRINAGNLLWVQPGVTQKFCTSKDFSSVKIYFARFQLSEGEQELSLESEYFFKEEFYHMQNHLHYFLMECNKAYEMNIYSNKASIAILLCDLLKNQKEELYASEGLKRFQVIKLQSYIHQNIRQRFTSIELAKELKLNQDYFSRLFKKTFQQSPREYINHERLRVAASLLMETNMNVSELSAYLGFPDIYQFSKQFKKVYKKSPNAYRKS